MNEFTDDELDSLDRPESYWKVQRRWKEYNGKLQSSLERLASAKDEVQSWKDRIATVWEELEDEELKLKQFRKAQEKRQRSKQQGG